MNAENKKRWLSWSLYIIAFVVIMQTANWWKSRDIPKGNISRLSGELMDGSHFSIADFSGKPILFHFWSTWCPICDLEKDSIESISHDYPVISIASWSEGKTEVSTYMSENQLTFPTMLDNDGELAQSFGLKGVPASFILSPEGEINYVETGYTTELGLRFRLWLSTL